MPKLESAKYECSWCRKDENQVKYIIVDNNSNSVCNECVEVFKQIDSEYLVKRNEI